MCSLWPSYVTEWLNYFLWIPLPKSSPKWQCPKRCTKLYLHMWNFHISLSGDVPSLPQNMYKCSPTQQALCLYRDLGKWRPLPWWSPVSLWCLWPRAFKNCHWQEDTARKPSWGELHATGFISLIVIVSLCTPFHFAFWKKADTKQQPVNRIYRLVCITLTLTLGPSE